MVLTIFTYHTAYKVNFKARALARLVLLVITFRFLYQTFMRTGIVGGVLVSSLMFSSNGLVSTWVG